MRILVDSSAWLGLEDADDGRHETATACWQSLQREPHHFLLSSWIFSETLTLVSRRLGSDRAYTLGRRLLDSDRVEIIHSDLILESQALLLMRSRKESGFSFTDAATWVIARSHGIDAVFAFDRHLLIPGILSLPDGRTGSVHEKPSAYTATRPKTRVRRRTRRA